MTDDAFVTRREFEAAQKYQERALGTLERSVHEGQRRTEEEMRRLTEAIKESSAARGTPNPDMQAAALALHDAAKAMREQPPPPSPQPITDILALAKKGDRSQWITIPVIVALASALGYFVR